MNLVQWPVLVCSTPKDLIFLNSSTCFCPRLYSILGSVAKSFSRNFSAEASSSHSTHQKRHPGPDMSNSSNIWSQVKSLAMWKFRFSSNIVLVACLSRRTFLCIFNRIPSFYGIIQSSFSIQAPIKNFIGRFAWIFLSYLKILTREYE